MSRYVYKSNSNDGNVFSYDADYLKARAGTGTLQGNDSLPPNLLGAGQWYNVGIYWLRQCYLEYTITQVPTTEIVTSAAMIIEGLEHEPIGNDWELECRDYDWGGSVTTSDWVAGADITGTTQRLCGWYKIRSARPLPPHFRTGGEELMDRLTSAGPLRIMLNSNKLWLAFSPSTSYPQSDEYVHFGSYEGGENYNRLRLDYQTAIKSSLHRVRDASLQLSDGSTVYLDADTAGQIKVMHTVDGTSPTQIATLSVGVGDTQYAEARGAQSVALTADGSDNLYVIGRRGSGYNQVIAKAFVKGVGYSWTAKTALIGDTPFYDGHINQLQATYHTTGSGFITVYIGHRQGQEAVNTSSMVSLSAASLKNGSGTLVASSIEVPGLGGSGGPPNTVGAGADLASMEAGRGILAIQAQDQTNTIGEKDTIARVWHYALNTAGVFTTSFFGNFLAYPTSGVVPADGNFTTRILKISSTKFAVLYPESIMVFTVTSTGALTRVASQNYHNAGLTALGTDVTCAKDAIYDAATNKVWIYYLDIANTRRLMRTGVSVSTGLLDGVETQVATALGASGSSHLSLRLPRGSVDERRVLVHLANKTGAGVLSTVLYADTGLNQAPNVPQLIAPGTFAASLPKQFTWVYSDQNPRDHQSAYEVEIRDQSSLVSMYDPGKVTSTVSGFTLPASTLSNNETYEWRVKTYDEIDQASAWTSWTVFSTTTAGTALITVPATDNEAGLQSSRLTIHWTFTGTLPQSEYRVRVIRTDTGAQVFDTGFILGPTVSEYTISGLLSQIEQRIELLIEDSGTNISNTATRLITPNYGSPPAPTFTATATAEGDGIVITVTNPTPDPDTDLPLAGRNDIYRALAETGEYIKVGEAVPNGQFTDYGAASGILYDYKVAGVASGDTFSEAVINVFTEFQGLYLHDPTDPTGTLYHFLYGKANKNENIETPATSLRFVGRVYPVLEYGEQLDETVKIDIVSPFGETHALDLTFLRALAKSRRTWLYRDSRGRKIFGSIRAMALNDLVHGVGASLTVVRVDYVEERP